MWVQKRVNLESHDEQALTRCIGIFEEALRMRSGAILRCERSSATQPSASIWYALPIEQS
jgi:hypothetical protein